MHRILALLLAVFLLTAQTADSTFSWPGIAARVEKSLARVTFPVVVGIALDVETGDWGPWIAEGVCTAFSINQKAGYFQSDYHCVAEPDYLDGMRIDGQPLTVVYANPALDLAVFQADLHKPALKRSKKKLEPGMNIATYGFGYGGTLPLFRAGVIAQLNYDLGPSYGPAHWLTFDQPFIGGMSGGPVFDLDGKVVGIVQLGDAESGYALPIETLFAHTGGYWR